MKKENLKPGDVVEFDTFHDHITGKVMAGGYASRYNIYVLMSTNIYWQKGDLIAIDHCSSMRNLRRLTKTEVLLLAY